MPSMVKVTGLPEAPPVADRVVPPPTDPVAGGLKVMAWLPLPMTIDCWTWGAAL